MENYNKLTRSETERIAILLEEASEVVQMCGKILRHGFDSYNPFDTKKVTNRILLANELGDLAAAASSMRDDISLDLVVYQAFQRPSKIKPYLHHQGN